MPSNTSYTHGAFAQIEEADNKKMLINKLTTTTTKQQSWEEEYEVLVGG